MSEKSEQIVVSMPVHIFYHRNLSARVKFIWAELSLPERGFVGEFVAKQKQLAQTIGISASTLRRAIRVLEENHFIQYVGLFDRRYKKYVFKNVDCVVIANEMKQSTAEHSKEQTENSIKNENKILDCHAIAHNDDESANKNVFVIANEMKQSTAEHSKEQTENSIKNENKILDCHAIARNDDEEDSDLPTSIGSSREFLNPMAGLVYSCCIADWKAQFPLLNGQQGRPMLDRYLIEDLFVKWRREAKDIDITVYLAEQLKRLSGEIIKPIPPMSNEAYLEAILKQEAFFFEALGQEEGMAMLKGLAGEWGFFNYENNKRNPKTRPGIARAIQAV